MDGVHTHFQECQADVKAFSRSQREVAAGIAKNLPDALNSIRARLQEAEATIEENEHAARENEVRPTDRQDRGFWRVLCLLAGRGGGGALGSDGLLCVSLAAGRRRWKV